MRAAALGFASIVALILAVILFMAHWFVPAVVMLLISIFSANHRRLDVVDGFFTVCVLLILLGVLARLWEEIAYYIN